MDAEDRERAAGTVYYKPSAEMLAAARAEGERAGREAAREEAALLVEDGHGNIGRMLAAAIRGQR